MTEHFNQLTPEQAELLTLLAEDCAEVIQAVTKIQRHGLDSRYDKGTSNIEQLHKELGDVSAACTLLMRIGVLSLGTVDAHMMKKIERVGQYLHHHQVQL